MTSQSEKFSDVHLNTGEVAVIFKRDGKVKLVFNLDKNDPDLTEPQIVVAAALSYLVITDEEWLTNSIDTFIEMKNIEFMENRE